MSFVTTARCRAAIPIAIVLAISLLTLQERAAHAQVEVHDEQQSRCYRSASIDMESAELAAQDVAFARDFLEDVDTGEDFDPSSCAWPYIDERLAIGPIHTDAPTGKWGALSLRLQLLWRSYMRSSVPETVGVSKRFETVENDQWLVWLGLVWTGTPAGAQR